MIINIIIFIALCMSGKRYTYNIIARRRAASSCSLSIRNVTAIQSRVMSIIIYLIRYNLRNAITRNIEIIKVINVKRKRCVEFRMKSLQS